MQLKVQPNRYLSDISSSSEESLGQMEDGNATASIDMIRKQGPEVKKSEENSIDAWNCFLPKEDHDLMMMRA